MPEEPYLADIQEGAGLDVSRGVGPPARIDFEEPDGERACTDLCRSDEQRSSHRNGYQGVGALIFRAGVIGFVPQGGTGDLVVPSLGTRVR